MKQPLSDKQKLQKLTQARAQAKRAGQSTLKLDAKIEKLRTMMGSVIQKGTAAKPSPSKFYPYKGVSKKPVRGGACTPK